MQLTEVVYEGGEVLDLALGSQREVLAGELKSRFTTIDLRAKKTSERAALLSAAKRDVGALLVRGVSGVQEATKYFTKARLFIDALGRSEIPEPRSLSQWAYRIVRVFVYGHEMSQVIRAAGIGRISQYGGPLLPTLQFDRAVPVAQDFIVGVPSLGPGVLEAIGRIKRAVRQGDLSCEIVATERVAGVITVASALDVAERCNLLLVPFEMEDRLGPNEGAILALASGRALCTVPSDSLYELPYPADKYLQAKKYVDGSYVDAAMRYVGEQRALDAWPLSLGPPEWDAIPREILRRLSA